MSSIDWIVMCGFLAFVVAYGTWKTRKINSMESYLLASRATPWYVVALSIMATQASAITFLSTPGQAYVDGMRFVQFYFGLPIAMIILSVVAVPFYHKLKVYTAYEFLEKRFDLKSRALASILFLIQRGVAAGFTIFAPALVLSTILNVDINITILLIGVLVIIYTTVGGTDAVNKTHFQQMVIIFFGMSIATYMIFVLLEPDNVSFMDATRIAGKMGKLNAIDFEFDPSSRYNIWSGILGGTFLMLSYFGTDQSQVQRYLSGASVKESRIGLLVNGIVKIPMQFVILFVGAMVFVFFQINSSPMVFNPKLEHDVMQSEYSDEYLKLKSEFDVLHAQKKNKVLQLKKELASESGITHQLESEIEQLKELEIKYRDNAKQIIKKANPSADVNDINYIFLNYVLNFMPIGLIGLVLAAIVSASMSSTSAELNALTSTTVIDIYQRLLKPNQSDAHYLNMSKLFTVGWGLLAITFAYFANNLGSLVEAVNEYGSLFYGAILGIFMVAFVIKRITGSAVFYATIIAEIIVISIYILDKTDLITLPFLWLNPIGCFLVILISFPIQTAIESKKA
jgi:SSS family transporter